MPRPLLVACVVGARPNFMKMASILDAAGRRAGITTRLIHTGQHYSPEMSDSFFRELELPRPDVSLEVGSGSQTQQCAAIMQRLEPVFSEGGFDGLVVVGDVTSTMAAALVAVKLGIPVAHVEAGLRSFDRRMPEETNRLVTDAISDLLFASETSGVENLRREGVPGERVFLVGNVMIDTLLRFRGKAQESRVLDELGVAPRGYAVATLHRPSNVDEPASLRRLVALLQEIAGRLPVVFPVHPRTRARLEAEAIDTTGLRLAPPLGYLDFLRLTSDARLVLTDSGGIQEETTILGVPCLTLRENTERPATIEQGTNQLVGTDPAVILRAAHAVLDGHAKPGRVPEKWDGQAGARIWDVLEERWR